jgi:two-component sensor histidine kinase/PAS domain-containing protein
MKELWKGYKERVEAACLESLQQADGIPYWRNKLFSTIITYLMPLGLTVLIPSIVIVFVLELYTLALAYLFFALSISLITLQPGLSVKTRKILLLGLIYLVASTLIFYMGALGAGLTYLFGTTFFALLIMPQKAGIWTVVINTLIVLIHGYFIHIGVADYPLRDQFEVISWFAIAANPIMLSIVAVIFMPMLFHGLQKTIENHIDLEKQLIVKQNELENTLESEMQANQRYHAITKITHELIWEWDIREGTHHWWLGSEGSEISQTVKDLDPSVESWLDQIHPDDRERVEKSFYSTAESSDNNIWQEEYRFLKQDGDYAYVYDRGYLIRDKEGNPVRFIGGLEDITRIKKNEIIAKDSLHEKETLLAEIHHRVKNNLAVVSGMMQIQAMKEEDSELSKKLLDSTLRIKSMANIHELLYQSNSFSQLDFGKSIKNLTDTILKTIDNGTDVSVSYQLDPIQLNINQAVPCSLIVNEVITNCMKHAFPGNGTGKIALELRKSGSDIILNITDNGIGISDEIDLLNSPSLGVELIQTLSKQLNGSYSYRPHPDQPGTLFNLSFSLK